MKRFLEVATALVVTMGLPAFGLAACSRPDLPSTAGRPAPAATAPTALTAAASAAASPALTPATATPAMPSTATLSTPATSSTPSTSSGATGVKEVRTMASMRVGPLLRSWLVITSTASLPASAPIIIELSGIGNTVSVESGRNRLLPYADAGQAELVYPVGIRQSWDAGGCCGPAGNLRINDVAFLEQLVPRIDPGHRRPVYVVGYSNGGRMAYALECADPGLVDGMAAVKADPMPGCEVRQPQNVLVISARDDPAVPFQAGQTGRESPAATVQIARLRQALGCAAKPVSAAHGQMTLTTWSSCSGARRLGWAVYTTGGHNFPPPAARSPSAAQIIWSFFTRTALAPLPA